ncbi:30S ribosomal protein S9 [Candidatus Gottesmanbacteria bacterium]|nr:30S ribosomal protein S9 [Candidatus Gottesmanbacteria bacterium]MBI5452231.1 30S ribosomal protein S9 [Candidatus Gottesmanbacteria bacterium]
MPRPKKQQTEAKTEKPVEKKTAKKPSFYQAVGRRKESTARVRLYVTGNGEVTIGNQTIKSGEMIINNRPIEQYFAGEMNKRIYMEPFRTTNTVGRFAVSAIISGGGLFGQLGAFIHGVSRSLEKADKEKFRLILKKKGFLTRDPRAKERRKAGFAQKARAKKQSPKR